MTNLPADFFSSEDFQNCLKKLCGIVTYRLLLEFNSLVEISKTKKPLDYQTKSDPIIENVIIATINQYFPDHNIFGEESGWKDSDIYSSDFTWVIDPIDGTRNFAYGIPSFGSNIALLYRLQPILGILSIPGINKCWVTYNEKVLLNSKSFEFKLQKLPICIAISKSTDFLVSKKLIISFDEILVNGLKNDNYFVIQEPTTINISTLLQGKPGYWIGVGCHYHDVAPGLLLAKNLGFQITSLDFQTTEISYLPNINFVVSNLENNDLDTYIFDKLRFLNTLMNLPK